MRKLALTCVAVAALAAACGVDDDERPGADASGDVAETGGPGDVAKPEVQYPDIPDRTEDVQKCKKDSDCDDGLFCNGVETCNPDSRESAMDGCVQGEPPKGKDDDPTDCAVLLPCDEETKGFPAAVLGEGDSCDDGIACTTGDVCNAAGTCKGTADDARCDDGLFCNGVETCNTAVGCLAGEPPEGVDDEPGDCLVPGPCDEATRRHTMVPAGVGKVCNDGIDCTTPDACTGAGTCEGVPNHGACTDGKFCNGAEQCVVGQGCKPGTAPLAPADESPVDCMVFGPCDEAVDTFPLVPAPAGKGCDDGVKCTVGDACGAEGVCVGAAEDAECSDGKFCNGAEHCDPAAGCQAGAAPLPPEDAEPDDCMVPSSQCDEQLDGFPLVPVAEGAACNDGVGCTTDDACDGDGKCAGEADDALCDDEKACNGAETCDVQDGCKAGEAPLPPADTDPTDCYAPSATCEEVTGLFPVVPVVAGTPCDDGVACTESDACQTGGTCAGTPNDALCSDKVVCNGKEVCSVVEGECAKGPPPTPPADDPDDCLTPLATCEEAAGGFPLVAVAAGTPCNDAIECTSGSKCTAEGACIGTPDHAKCANGLFCDGVEVCDTSTGCKAGTPAAPPPDDIENDCLGPGPCKEGPTGPLFPLAALADGVGCDDLDPCSAGDACEEGMCIGQPAPDGTKCDDGNPATTAEKCAAGACTCVPECDGKEACASDGCGGQCAGGGFSLCSPAFAPGGPMKAPNVCKSPKDLGKSPALTWADAPVSAKSFAVVCVDPDGGDWVHWIAWNVPGGWTGLDAAVPAEHQPALGIAQGKNDFGVPGYGGPCPPPNGVHHYVFTLYALDVATLSLDASAATKAGLQAAMAGHVVATATVTGTYEVVP